MLTVLLLIKNKLVKSVHDCSKGGLSVALIELSIFGNIGCNIDVENIPCKKNLSSEEILFSESHSRYLLVIDKKNIANVEHLLSKKKISFAVLGKFSGDQINIKRKSQNLVKLRVDQGQKRYFNGLEDLLKHG
jgi:phosphoribosylformylglycinamidine synthase